MEGRARYFFGRARRADFAFGRAFALGLGLVLCFAFGLDLVFGFAFGLAFGFALGLTLGLAFDLGLAFGLGRAFVFVAVGLAFTAGCDIAAPFECNANAAPCGSMHITTRSPPGQRDGT